MFALAYLSSHLKLATRAALHLAVLSCLLFLPSPLAAKVLQLGEAVEHIKIGSYLTVLEDPKDLTSLDAVRPLFETGKVLEFNKDTVSLGYKRKGLAWAKMQIENPSQQSRKVWMVSRYSSLDYLSVFYQAPDGSVQMQVQGDNLPIKTRAMPHRLPVFALEIAPGLSTIYFKIETSSALIFDFELWDPPLFVPHELRQTTIVGLLFGVCVVMFFYNFFVFLKFNDFSYLYYSIYIGAYVTFSAWYHGLAQQFLFPEAEGHWLFRNFLFHVVDVITLAALAFSVEFLHIKIKMPRIYRLIRVLQLLVLINLAVAILASVQTGQITLLLNLIMSFVLIIVGVIRCFSFRPARYYTLAWCCLLIGNILHMAANQGAITGTTFTFWAQFMGAALELLLLSLALGERVALLNQEREESLRQQKKLQEEAFQLEKTAREANERALEEEKRLNEQRDQLVANTSHELRTPLNGMMGLAQAILRREGAGLSEDSRRSLDGILKSGQRLAALIGDLLDFSQGQRAEIQLYRGAVSLREQLDFVLLILQPTLQKQGLELKNSLRDDLPPVYADPQRIQQIFFNLIGNAIKFTEQGSITISASKQDDFLIVRVKDTGIGIAESAQAKIFEAFTQADGGIARKFGGTGLGLAIVRELIVAHSGEVGVQSVPGFGSTFWFTLPIASGQDSIQGSQAAGLLAKMVSLEAQLQAGNAAVPSLSAAGSDGPLEATRRPDSSSSVSHLEIVVVDDELMNRQVLGELLTLMGHRVHTMGCGAELLNWLSKHEKPDLILLDIMMPEMSGYEVLSELRKTFNEADLPIIILSAKALEKDLLQGFALGASDYILKPFSASEIESRVMHQARLKQAILASRAAYQENSELKNILEQVEDQLLHAERLASIGAATAGIAHEIGNPLNHLKTLVAWLADDFSTLRQSAEVNAAAAKATEKHIQLSLRAVDTLLSISQSLRVAVRSDQGVQELIDPRQVVEDVRHILQHKLKKISFETSVEDGISFRGKHSECIQLLSNLVGNAADALEEAKADKIFLRIFRQDGRIHITVEDGGPGIPAQIVEKIFDPFFTTKKAGKGTGLGLAVVKTITKKWNAELRVGRSESLGGASFDIVLPAA